MKQDDSKYNHFVIRPHNTVVKKELVRYNSKHLFYYSFYIGVNRQRRQSWELLDWKTPSPDIKLALIQFKMIWHYSMLEKSERLAFTPKGINARSGIVRQIIEFQGVKRTGKTLIQYKKIHVYNYHEFKDLV